MKKSIGLFLAAFLIFTAFVQQTPNGATSLIVAVYDTQNLSQVVQHIYRYNFLGGEFIGKEKVITVTGRKDSKDYIRCDVGVNRIYKSRFLITGIGNIIDLQTKKVVSDNRAQWVSNRGDSIIFYTNDIFKGKFYSYFNIKTGVYEEIKSPLFKAIKGQDIEVDYSTQNRRIYLYPPNAAKILLVNDAGYGEALVTGTKNSNIPFYWLDDNQFLFPYYNVSKNECTLILYNVKDKSQTRFEKIIDIPKSRENSYFDQDGEGNLEYVCAKGKFIVDVKGKKLNPIVFEHLGHHFDVEYYEQPYGHSIKYGKDEIGKYHFDLRQVKSGKNAIALYNLMKIGPEFYPQGIAVWDKNAKKWLTVEADEVASICGWAE